MTRGVAALKAGLGVPLLTRTTRAVRLTDKGEQFVAPARRLLQEHALAEQEITGAADLPIGVLAMSASVTFGRYMLASVISEFLEVYRDVDVSLLLAERLVDLVEEGIDVTIRIGQLVDSSLMARRVGAVQRMLVASPDYLARRGTPDAPADLAGHGVIAFTGLL